MASDSIGYVHSSAGHALRMLNLSDGVASDTLQNGLEYTISSPVDDTRGAFHATAVCHLLDGALHDAINLLSTSPVSFNKLLLKLTCQSP